MKRKFEINEDTDIGLPSKRTAAASAAAAASVDVKAGGGAGGMPKSTHRSRYLETKSPSYQRRFNKLSEAVSHVTLPDEILGIITTQTDPCSQLSALQCLRRDTKIIDPFGYDIIDCIDYCQDCHLIMEFLLNELPTNIRREAGLSRRTIQTFTYDFAGDYKFQIEDEWHSGRRMTLKISDDDRVITVLDTHNAIEHVCKALGGKKFYLNSIVMEFWDFKYIDESEKVHDVIIKQGFYTTTAEDTDDDSLKITARF